MAGTNASVPLASSGSEVTAGPGQIRKAPADAEHRGAGDEWDIDVPCCRKMEPLGQHGLRPAQHQPVADQRHRHRARHHEDEARIEAAGQIEEVLHLGGIRHARDQQAEPNTRPARKLAALFISSSDRVTHHEDRGEAGRHEGRRRDERAGGQPRDAAHAVSAGAAAAHGGAPIRPAAPTPPSVRHCRIRSGRRVLPPPPRKPGAQATARARTTPRLLAPPSA